MKVFICTDLHGSRQALLGINNLLSKKESDAVFMLGDVCDRHDLKGLEYAEDFINLVTQTHNLPLYLIHGNNEPAAVKLLYQQRDVTVNFNEKSLGKYKVIGVGSGDAYPTDPQFASGKILLTHEPPHKSVLEKMQEHFLPNAPLIHFAGHLHTKGRIYQLKPSVFVQAPAALNGQAASLELPSLKVRFIDLG